MHKPSAKRKEDSFDVWLCHRLSEIKNELTKDLASSCPYVIDILDLETKILKVFNDNVSYLIPVKVSNQFFIKTSFSNNKLSLSFILNGACLTKINDTIAFENYEKKDDHLSWTYYFQNHSQHKTN